MRVLRLPGIHHDASCVIISGDERTVVVDPGTSWYQTNVLERIEANLSGGPDVGDILLTHRHYDTAGGAKFLSEHWQIPVHIHSEGVPAISSGDMFTTWASRFNSDMPPTPAESMEGGAIFDLGGSEIEVLYLPGHSSDSVGFYIAEKSLLIAGDLIPKSGHPSRWDLPTGCLPDLLSSIESVQQLDLDILIPGHGSTISGFANIKEELEQHQECLAECVSMHGTRPPSWPRPAATCNWFTPEPAW